jgi:hypothetical protein
VCVYVCFIYIYIYTHTHTYTLQLDSHGLHSSLVSPECLNDFLKFT